MDNPTIEEIRGTIKSYKNGEIFLDYFLQNVDDISTWVPVKNSCSMTNRRDETPSATGKYKRNPDYPLEFIVHPNKNMVTLGIVIPQNGQGSHATMDIDNKDMELHIYSYRDSLDKDRENCIRLNEENVQALGYISEIHKEVSDIIYKFEEGKDKLRKDLITK